MTKKQMRKIAQEVYDLNLIHDNPKSSDAERARAEKRIINITKQIMCLPRNLEVLGEIDSMVQSINEINNKETI